MAITVGSIVVKASLDATQLNRDAARARGSIDGLSESAKRSGQSLVTAGRGLLPFSAAIAGLGVATAKAAINFESGLAGVAKTTNFTKEGLKAFGQEVRDLSKEIPVGTGELLKIAEAAGQLGVKEKDILGFSETMAALGETTNLSATQAATAIARFNNIFGESNDNVVQLGSTIVDLGNNFATTESEIVTMASRLAGAGKTVGLTQQETLGLATALSSVGVLAEAGGSAFSQVMLRMQSAVETTGEKLDVMAKVAGMSSDEFATAFKNEPMVAIQAFIEGLERVRESGGNTTAILQDLNLDGIRVSDALRRAATAGDLVGRAMDTANTAFSEGTALQVEVERRYETTAAQLEIFKNKIVDLAIDFGQVLIPALLDFVSAMEPVIGLVKDAIGWFNDAPPMIKNMGIALMVVTAAVGPLVIGVGMLTMALSALNIAILPLSVALGTVATVAAIGLTVWGDYSKGQKEAADRADILAEALNGVADATNKTVVEAILSMDVFTSTADAWRKSGIEMSGVVSVMETGTDVFHKMGNSFAVSADAVGNSVSVYDQLRSMLEGASPEAKRLGEEIIRLGQNGAITRDEMFGMFRAVDEGADAFDDVVEPLQATVAGLIDARGAITGFGTAADGSATTTAELVRQMVEGSRSSVELNAAQAILTGTSDDFTVSFQAAIDEVSQSGAPLEAARVAVEHLESAMETNKAVAEAMGEAIGSIISPAELTSRALEIATEKAEIFAREQAVAAGESAESWQDFAGDVVVSFADYEQALDDALAAAQAFKDNTMTIMAKLPQEMWEDAFSIMETMPAETVAEMTSLSGPELQAFFEKYISMANLTRTSFEDSFKSLPEAMANLGSILPGSFARGIWANVASSNAAAFNMGIQAVNAAYAGVDAGSPSKEMIKLGLFMGEGLAIGIEDSAGIVAQASQFLAEAALGGIIDGFSDVGEAAGALRDAIAQIEWERETQKLEDQRAALQAMREELPLLEQAAKDAWDAHVESWVAQRGAFEELKTAYAELALAKEANKVNTQTEEAAILQANIAVDDAETKLSDLRFEYQLLGADIHNSTEYTNDSKRAMIDAEIEYRNAETAVKDLTFEMDMLTFAGRDLSEMTLDSEIAIAAAVVGLDKQREKVGKLRETVAKAKEGTDAWRIANNELYLEELKVTEAERTIAEARNQSETGIEKQAELADELALANLGVEDAVDNSARALHDAVTIGEESARIADQITLAEEGVEQALRDSIKAEEDAILKDKDVQAAQEAVEAAQDAYTEAVQDTMDKEKLAREADQKVIDKKAEIETAQQELELATLKFALKWLDHMVDNAKATEDSAGRTNAALDTIPSEVDVDVNVNTTEAERKAAAFEAKMKAMNTRIKTIIAGSLKSDEKNAEFNAGIKAVTAEFAPIHIGPAAKPPKPAPQPSLLPTTTGLSGSAIDRSKGPLQLGGGYVNGMVGKAMPITAHGGEFVIPADVVRAIEAGKTNGQGIASMSGGSSGGGGDTIIINVNGKATRQDAEEVVQALRDWERRRGAIPISVRG